MDGRVINPTILVGVGAAGAEIVRAVEVEGAGRGDPAVHEHVRFIIADDPVQIEVPFTRALDALLGLSSVAAVRRDHALWTVPVDVFVVAELGPGHTDPAALAGILAALDPGVARHAQRLVGPDGRPRLTVSPVLLLPTMPAASVDPAWEATPDQAAVIAALARLRGRIVDPPSTCAPIGRVYIAEPGTRTVLLTPESRRFMARAFLCFLLYGSLRRQPDYRAAWERRAWGPDADDAGARGAHDAFGSFLVATCELSPGTVQPYLRARVAIEGLDAFRRSRDEALISEKAADEETVGWVEPLLASLAERTEAAIDAVATGALAPLLPTPRPMGLFEGGEAFAARVADPPWFGTNATHAERARTRAAEDDGRVAEILEAVDLDGAAAVREAGRALADHLEAICLSPDAPGHHTDGLRLVREVSDVVGQRVDAVGAQAMAPPPSAQPAVATLGRTFEEMVAAARLKPHPGRLLGLGFGVLALIALCVQGLLPLLGLLFAAPALMDPSVSPVVAFGVTLGLGGLWLVSRLSARTRDVNRYLIDEDLLGTDLRALKRALRREIEARRDAALAHGAARLLTRHQHQLGVERRALSRADQALEAQWTGLHQQLRVLGAEGDVATAPPRLRDDVLARPVVSGRTLVALGRRVTRHVLGDDPIGAVKRALDPYRDRHRRLPFGDLSGLQTQAGEVAAGVSLAALWDDPEHGDEVRDNVARFIDESRALTDLGGGRAAGSRLSLPLDLAGLHGDRSGVRGLEAPKILAVDAVLQRVTVPEGVVTRPFFDPHRLYLLQVAWGIAPGAIGWLGPAWENVRRPTLEVVPTTDDTERSGHA